MAISRGGRTGLWQRGRAPGAGRTGVGALVAALCVSLLVGACAAEVAPGASGEPSASAPAASAAVTPSGVETATPGASGTGVASDAPVSSPAPSGQATAVPTGTPAAPIRPPATPSPTRTPALSGVPGLPAAFAGSRVVSTETKRFSNRTEYEVVYDVPAGALAVRDHYRRELRRDGWRIGEVELDGVTWEIEATRDGREIEVEIAPRGSRSRVEVELTVLARP